MCWRHHEKRCGRHRSSRRKWSREACARERGSMVRAPGRKVKLRIWNVDCTRPTQGNWGSRGRERERIRPRRTAAVSQDDETQKSRKRNSRDGTCALTWPRTDPCEGGGRRGAGRDAGVPQFRALTMMRPRGFHVSEGVRSKGITAATIMDRWPRVRWIFGNFVVWFLAIFIRQNYINLLEFSMFAFDRHFLLAPIKPAI